MNFTSFSNLDLDLKLILCEQVPGFHSPPWEEIIFYNWDPGHGQQWGSPESDQGRAGIGRESGRG
jgi:hypothetical protein